MTEEGGARRPWTPEELLAYLESLGADTRTHAHPPVFTVAEARRHRGSLPGAHTKNLFLRDKKGAMWLVVVLEDRTVDLKELARRLGHRRFSFGSAQRLMRVLGVVPGAVTPFAVVNDREGAVRVALDRGLQAFDVWNFHPLDNARTTSIRAADMLRFLRETGHDPVWVEVPSQAEAPDDGE